jgi:hypothetical protein
MTIEVDAMTEAPSLTRSTSPLTAAVVVAEGTAAVILVAALLFLPWFQITYPKNIALPPGSYTWGDWHNGFIDQAVLLTLVAPFVSLAAALARAIFRRRWTMIALLVGFVAAFAGSVETFGDAGVINPTPGATTTPGIGLWLFAGAAVAGLLTTATDLVVSSARARF